VSLMRVNSLILEYLLFWGCFLTYLIQGQNTCISSPTQTGYVFAAGSNAIAATRTVICLPISVLDVLCLGFLRYRLLRCRFFNFLSVWKSFVDDRDWLLSCEL